MKRSKCHYCAQPITQKTIINADDADKYINEYCAYDDDIAWIAKDGTAICFSNDVAHCTTKDWYAAQ